jgi:putative transposase
MPSTHLSLYYHLVFSTKDRLPWIDVSWETRFHQYIAGIVRDIKGKAIEIGGDADHAHILASLRATNSISEVLQNIKSGSSRWVHEMIGLKMFQWQEGYGAFTVSKSEIEGTKNYISNQREHHRKKTFQEEYLELLKQHEIEFNEKYLW